VSQVRRARSLIVLSLLLGSAGCWLEDDLGKTYVSGIPFVTPHVARGTANLQIIEATGYACPDGKVSQVYLVTPEIGAESYPLALLYHSRSFDYVDILGEHYGNQDRLNSTWAIDQVRRALGMESLSEVPSSGEGAWVAALLESGFAVAAPANCWGDLWHGRGGNSLVDEGFLRLGGYLADDTIRIAGEAAPIDDDFVVAIGLGEGGRAITELALTGVPLRAVVIDSSPDLLSPLIDQPVINAQYIVGLSRIYDDEVRHLEEQVDVLAALLTSVQRDSMVNVVQNLGFRLPIVYAHSETDTRISPLLAAPAASAIEVAYQSPPGSYLLRNWPDSGHALSNRTVDEARTLVAWLLEQTGPHIPAPGDDDSAAP
jgi:hypothetical protein